MCQEVFGGTFFGFVLLVMCMQLSLRVRSLLFSSVCTVYHHSCRLVFDWFVWFCEVFVLLTAPFYAPIPAAYKSCVPQADFPSEKQWRREKWIKKKKRNYAPDLDRIVQLNQRYDALCRAESRMHSAALLIPPVGPTRPLDVARLARLTLAYEELKQEVFDMMRDFRASATPDSHFSEHAGFSALMRYPIGAGDPLKSGLMASEMVRLTSYLVMLRDCHSYRQFLAIITNFVLTQFPQESAELIQGVIDSISSPPTVSVEQSGFADFKFTSIADIWNCAKHSKLIDKLKKLLALLVFCGVIKTGTTKLGILDFSDFYEHSSLAKLKSTDMVSFILDVATNLLDSVSYVWSTGDWRSLFSGITQSQRFYAEYSEVSQQVQLLKIGNLSVMSCTALDLVVRIRNLEEDVKRMAISSTPQENSIYIRYGRELRGFLSDVIDINNRMPIVPAPFAVVLTGTPGVGKSNFYSSIIVAISHANGFPAGAGDICTTNPASKFDDGYNWHSVQVFDDIAQTKSEKREGLVSDLFIRTINNVPSHALKSESKEKGKILYSAKLIIGTTNVPDLDARSEVIEPAAVLRRWNYFVDMKLKPQYCIDGGIALDAHKIGTDVDLWIMTVTKYKVTSTDMSTGVAQGYQFEVCDADGPLTDIGVERCLRFLVDKSKEHYADQAALVTKVMASYSAGVCLCKLPVGICTQCPRIDIPPVPSPVINPFGSPASYFGSSSSEQASFDDSKQCVKDFIDAFPTKTYQFFTWLNTYAIEPLNFWMSYVSLLCVGLLTAAKISPTKNVIYGYLFYAPKCVLGFTFSLVAWTFGYFLMLSLSGFLCLCVRQWYNHQNAVIRNLLNSVVKVPPEWIIKYGRAHMWWKRNKVWIGLALAAALAIKTTYAIGHKTEAAISSGRLYEEKDPFFFADPVVHGGIGSTPRTLWTPPYVAPVGLHNDVKTITSRDLLALFSTKMGYAEFTREDGISAHCNIFPVSGTSWLAPYHVMKEGIVKISVRRGEGLGGAFSCAINRKDWVRLDQSDMVLVSLVHGCTNRNFVPYFPKDVGDLSNIEGIMLNKTAECVVEQIQVTKLHGASRLVEPEVSFSCFDYQTSRPTFVGLCVAPVIAITKHPIIAGFHIRGITDGYTGMGHIVTSDMLGRGFASLEASNGIVTASLSEHDIQALFPGTVHHKSPLNFLDSDVPRSITALGEYTSPDGAPAVRSVYNSTVKTTILSEPLAVRGLPNNWGPPMFKPSWKPFYAFLAGISSVTAFCPNYRDMAVVDYLRKIDAAIDLNPSLLSGVRVMTDAETLEGVDGVSSLEGMKLDTSLGFPYRKKKNTWFTRVQRADLSGWDVIPPPDFWNRIRTCELKMAEGQRLPFVFTNIPKDESVKIGKEKVRIFSSGDIFGLTIMRKHCMSLAKLVIDNQFLFECSVGISTPSKDWDAAAKHLLAFGDGRLIAGDYAAFDQNMPADFILKAFSILVHIAERSGYTPTQLAVLRTIASEISHPVYESNGEFYIAHGSNPSGHQLTSIINSIVNALYLRTCYYQLYEGKPPGLFSNHVHLLTFGDDNIMGVSSEAGLFNHVTIAECMLACGLTYTTADKTPVVRPYITLAECTFLKRRFVYDSDYGVYVAPIEKNSIYKSLHAAVKSKSISVEQQCAATIDTALLEASFHGEEFYSSLACTLRAVCEEVGILSFVRAAVWVSYSGRVQAWHESYDS